MTCSPPSHCSPAVPRSSIRSRGAAKSSVFVASPGFAGGEVGLLSLSLSLLSAMGCHAWQTCHTWMRNALFLGMMGVCHGFLSKVPCSAQMPVYLACSHGPNPSPSPMHPAAGGGVCVGQRCCADRRTATSCSVRAGPVSHACLSGEQRRQVQGNLGPG